MVLVASGSMLDAHRISPSDSPVTIGCWALPEE